MIRKGPAKNAFGFTLLEILVVVIVLGILAMIIVSQIYLSNQKARLNTLRTNLNNIRFAVALYYHQHNDTYPGIHDEKGDPAANKTQAQKAFVAQLTGYTDINGEVNNEKDGTYKFGPYLKSSELPLNPYNNDQDVVCDITTTNIMVRESDGSSGWKFYTKTGVLIANDGAHDLY